MRKIFYSKGKTARTALAAALGASLAFFPAVLRHPAACAADNIYATGGKGGDAAGGAGNDRESSETRRWGGSTEGAQGGGDESGNYGGNAAQGGQGGYASSEQEGSGSDATKATVSNKTSVITIGTDAAGNKSTYATAGKDGETDSYRGTGGAGGSVTWTEAIAKLGVVSITGGAGGAADAGLGTHMQNRGETDGGYAIGGKGGDAKLTDTETGAVETGAITVSGGAGAGISSDIGGKSYMTIFGGGSNTAGGAGGAAVLEFTRAERVTVTGNITLTGGAGGGVNLSNNSIYWSTYNATGGAGGDAELDFVKAQTVTVAGSVTIESGATGSKNVSAPNSNWAGDQTAGQGGAAQLSIADGKGTLILDADGTSTFTRPDGGGQVEVSIGATQIAAGKSVTLTFTNTDASDVKMGTFFLASGATLNIKGTGYSFSGLTAEAGATLSSALDLSNKTLTFILPSDLSSYINGGSPLLTATGGITVDSDTVLTLSAPEDIAALKNGDAITLANKVTGGNSLSGTYTAKGKGTMEYKFAVTGSSSANSPLTAAYQGPDIAASSENAKVYSEALLSGLMNVSASYDLIERQAYMDALAATKRADYSEWAGFFSLDGGREKIKTGSYVKTNHFNLLGGAAKNKKLSSGELLTSVFLEGGWGSYSTFNSFSSGLVYGGGDTNYAGLGVMLKNRAGSGLYYEASLRGGRVSTDFSSPGIGAGASIDSSAAYFGGHLGFGKETKLRSGALDTSLKLFFTRQGGDSLSNQAGERLYFDAANSLRLRLGTRYSKAVGKKASFFGGIAAEYEFGGKLKGSIDGIRIAEPDMEGASGIIELGIVGKAGKAWSAEAAAQGLFGKRRGFGGTVSLNYAF